MERFHQYSYGQQVTVDSDHQQLETIFKKPLAYALRRQKKTLMRLQQYDVSVRYKRGKEMYLADTLSRHYHTETTPGSSQTHRPQSQFEEELEHTQQIEEVNQLVASTETVLTFKKEANKNETLQAVKVFV